MAIDEWAIEMQSIECSVPMCGTSRYWRNEDTSAVESKRACNRVVIEKFSCFRECSEKSSIYSFSWSGMGLSPLVTSSTVWPVVPTPDDG
jgi:hypothetical protein